MTDFASEVMWHQLTIAKVFYFIGCVNGFAAMVLIIGGVIGLFLRPAPRNFARVLEGFAMVVLIASTLVAGAYVAELVIAATTANRFERWTFWQTRWSWNSWYSFVYYGLQMTALIAPQLFWWRRFRRSAVAILVVAMLVTTGIWFERVVIEITKREQEFLPGSWQRY
jgi:hypothetical protein